MMNKVFYTARLLAVLCIGTTCMFGGVDTAAPLGVTAMTAEATVDAGLCKINIPETKISMTFYEEGWATNSPEYFGEVAVTLDLNDCKENMKHGDKFTLEITNPFNAFNANYTSTPVNYSPDSNYWFAMYQNTVFGDYKIIVEKVNNDLVLKAPGGNNPSTTPQVLRVSVSLSRAGLEAAKAKGDFDGKENIILQLNQAVALN